jgi:hypothetical protein
MQFIKGFFHLVLDMVYTLVGEGSCFAGGFAAQTYAESDNTILFDHSESTGDITFEYSGDFKVGSLTGTFVGQITLGETVIEDSTSSGEIIGVVAYNQTYNFYGRTYDEEGDLTTEQSENNSSSGGNQTDVRPNGGEFVGNVHIGTLEIENSSANGGNFDGTYQW